MIMSELDMQEVVASEDLFGANITGFLDLRAIAPRYILALFEI